MKNFYKHKRFNNDSIEAIREMQSRELGIQVTRNQQRKLGGKTAVSAPQSKCSTDSRPANHSDSRTNFLPDIR